jgi:cytochrome c-type biogenesis protein CcmH/NrfG
MGTEVQELVDEATFDFTMGEVELALEKLNRAVGLDAASFGAWHALAEIYFDVGRYEEALEAGSIAAGLEDENVHIHTTLSRIWMEKGNKEMAEEHGARARVLGWKEQLKEES